MKNFTRKFTFVSGLLLVASFAEAQTSPVYLSLSIIGSATGWVADTPMRLVSASDVHNWTVTLPLTAILGSSEVKFRTTNDWSVNWGATGFPTGTGVANGPNIPIASAGTYTVRFNDVTGGYSFTAGALASKAGSDSALALTLYPDPAHETLSVAYDLSAAGPTSLTVYNQLGQPVRHVAAVHQRAGGQTQELHLQGLAAGLYVVQFQAGSQRQTARVVVE